MYLPWLKEELSVDARGIYVSSSEHIIFIDRASDIKFLEDEWCNAKKINLCLQPERDCLTLFRELQYHRVIRCILVFEYRHRKRRFDRPFFRAPSATCRLHNEWDSTTGYLPDYIDITITPPEP